MYQIISKCVDKGIKRTAFMKQLGISPSTLAGLSKNMPTRMDVLAKICILLDCGLDDIVEFYREADHEETDSSSVCGCLPKQTPETIRKSIIMSALKG